MEGLKIYIKHDVNITGRTLAILDLEVDIKRKDLDKLYDIQPNYLLTKKYHSLVTIHTIHRKGASEPLITQALNPANSKIPAEKVSP